MPHAIVLIGPQGSGKGTLSEFVKLLGFYHAEMGRILRKDPRVKEYTDNGKLCPDHIVREVFLKEVGVSSEGNNIIVDGVPRNRLQVGMVCEVLSYYDKLFVSLECDFITCVDRIEGRAKEAIEKDLVRADDINSQAIYNRLNQFHIERDVILEELERRRERVISINANKSTEEVRVQFVTEVCPLVFSRIYA